MGDNWKEITAEWHSGDAFIGRNPAGATVQMGKIDGKPGIGPMEMLLFGLAGCSGMDIISILQKQRQPVDSFQIKVRGKRASDYPMVYTEIEVEYILTGKGLNPKFVEQAIELSEEKYCSVGIMLRRAVDKVTTSYRILEPGQSLKPVAEM